VKAEAGAEDAEAKAEAVEAGSEDAEAGAEGAESGADAGAEGADAGAGGAEGAEDAEAGAEGADAGALASTTSHRASHNNQLELTLRNTETPPSLSPNGCDKRQLSSSPLHCHNYRSIVLIFITTIGPPCRQRMHE
jgi:hypothetical protein